ncbi:MAG: cupin domain-containing protein [Cyclobacteriaceae bacterium]
MRFHLSFLILITAQFVLAQTNPISHGVYRWPDHKVSQEGDREVRAILEGTTPHFSYLEMHVTTQAIGAQPSEMHANDTIEEVIIVREGLMGITIDGKVHTLGAESVVILLPGKVHSIKNVGELPLSYWVMRYRSHDPIGERPDENVSANVFDAESLVFKLRDDGVKGGTPYFDRSTYMCERFEMHITQLNKIGPSHKAHVHTESEIILVLSGNTEMTIAGETYQGGPGDFYFAKEDQLHGIANTSDETCRYFAFKWK